MLGKHKRKFVVISTIVILVFAFCKCIDKKQEKTDVRGSAFAGANKCAQCHKDIHQSYLTTAHQQTSHPATKAVVKGSFETDKNSYYYKPEVKIMMEERSDGLYQVAYQNNQERQASRFDIAIGSGRKAQTYLYWMGEQVYQLPISYFVPAKSWVNSPGYPAKQVRFDRNIPIGCFECHSSNIKVKSNEVVGANYINNFDRNSIIYGIDCERCHGPAAEHVDFHQENPQEKKAKFIPVFKSLSRVQKVDMCAVCHSGIQQTTRSTFNFVPGDTLNNNYFTSTENVNVYDLDVHGNQKQLMMASACYIKTNTLTCSSCHNTHTNERENVGLFSKRCMSCHSEANHNFCTFKSDTKINLIDNCIDCHMPEKQSKVIRLLSNGQATPTPNLVRTHLVAIYPAETKTFLAKTKQKQ